MNPQLPSSERRFVLAVIAFALATYAGTALGVALFAIPDKGINQVDWVAGLSPIRLAWPWLFNAVLVAMPTSVLALVCLAAVRRALPNDERKRRLFLLIVVNVFAFGCATGMAYLVASELP